MRKHFEILIYLCISAIGIVGCKTKPTISPKGMPGIDIPENEMNTRIRLAAPSGWNTFRINDGVGITVEVISDDQIAFTYDFGARMFFYDNDHWVAVANLMKYPEGYLILPQGNDNPVKFGVVEVVPILPDIHESITLRIILIGKIYRDGEITNEESGAYIDVVLHP